jgi:hypothetical protein
MNAIPSLTTEERRVLAALIRNSCMVATADVKRVRIIMMLDEMEAHALLRKWNDSPTPVKWVYRTAANRITMDSPVIVHQLLIHR